MTSKKTTVVSSTVRPACKFPGCDQPAAPADNPGRPPEYCAGRGHTRASAWKERRRANAEKNGVTVSAADDASPVTMAKVGGAELLRSLRAEADRISALGKELRERIDVLTDPTAAEVEVEAVRTAPPPRTLLPARPRRSRGGAGREPSPPRPGRRRASEPLRGGGPGALARVPVGQLQQGGEPGGVLHPAG